MLTERQIAALTAFGVAAEDHEAFANGTLVALNYATATEDRVSGFLWLAGDRLVAQLFVITSGGLLGAAALAVRTFQSRSFELARALDIRKLELQGGTVIDAPMRAFLERRGFALKTVPAPWLLRIEEDDMQEVFFKEFEVEP